jgi:CxxC motif-containing protein
MTELICIVCPRGCRLQVDAENGYRVLGNQCPRGEVYGRDELRNPTRMITSTVRVNGALHPRCPVKTSSPIPKGLIFDAVKTLDGVTLCAPVKSGQVVVKNVCNTGVDFIATRDMQQI